MPGSFDDEKQYQVQVSRPVVFRGVEYLPRHKSIVMSGAFIKKINAQEDNETWIGAHLEVEE